MKRTLLATALLSNAAKVDIKSVAGLGEEVHDGEEKCGLLCRTGKSVKCWERQRHARVETRSDRQGKSGFGQPQLYRDNAATKRDHVNTKHIVIQSTCTHATQFFQLKVSYGGCTFVPPSLSPLFSTDEPLACSQPQGSDYATSTTVKRTAL